MFKNRSLQVKVMKDVPEPGSRFVDAVDHDKTAMEISDAVIHAAEEISKTAAKVVVAYIVMDTWRKVTINIFSR